MLKEEFDDTLKKVNLNRKEFATAANISYNTINNWNNTTKPVPNWVNSWLKNYEKSMILNNIITSISPHIKTN
jgi:predicted transcriptional regulator